MAETVVERHVVALGFRTDMGSLRDAKRSMAGFIGAVGAGIVAAGAFVVGQAAMDDELTKTAHSLGITTEAYTALSYAMDREGVSGEKLQTALRGLQNQLEASSRGAGEAHAWFVKMGVSATDAAGNLRLASDVLPDLADGLQGLSTADKAAAALRIFGESGARMGAALAKGGDNLRDLLLDAERLGYVLDEETGAEAEALTDSMTRLSAVSTGLGREFSRELTPATRELVDQMTEFLAAEDGIVRVGVRKFAEGMGVAFAALGTDAGKAAAGIALVGAATQLPSLLSGVPIIGGIATAIGSISAPAVLATAALIGAVLVVDDLAVASRGGDSAIMGLAESMGLQKELAEGLATANSKAAGSMGMLEAAAGAGGRAAWGATKPWRMLGAALENVPRYFRIGAEVGLSTTALDLWSRAVGGALANLKAFMRLITNFDGAARGFNRVSEWFDGDEAANPINAISGAIQGQSRELVASINSGGGSGGTFGGQAPSINATVTIDAGPPPEMIARMAGDEVESKILEGFSAIPGYGF